MGWPFREYVGQRSPRTWVVNVLLPMLLLLKLRHAGICLSLKHCGSAVLVPYQKSIFEAVPAFIYQQLFECHLKDELGNVPQSLSFKP